MDAGISCVFYRFYSILAQAFQVSGGDAGLDILVLNSIKGFGRTIGGDTDVHLDDRRRDQLLVGSFLSIRRQQGVHGRRQRLYPVEMPGVAVPLTIGAVRSGACGTGEGDRIAAVFGWDICPGIAGTTPGSPLGRCSCGR